MTRCTEPAEPHGVSIRLGTGRCRSRGAGPSWVGSGCPASPLVPSSRLRTPLVACTASSFPSSLSTSAAVVVRLPIEALASGTTLERAERDAAIGLLVQEGASAESLFGLGAAVEGALAAQRRSSSWRWAYARGTEEGETDSAVILVHLSDFDERDLDLQTRLQRVVRAFLSIAAADRTAVALEYAR